VIREISASKGSAYLESAMFSFGHYFLGYCTSERLFPQFFSLDFKRYRIRYSHFIIYHFYSMCKSRVIQYIKISLRCVWYTFYTLWSILNQDQIPFQCSIVIHQ